MSKHSCVVVRPLLVGGACVLLALTAACSPRHVQWMATDPTVGPQMVQPAPPSPPHGFLSIVTQHFGEPGDEETETYPPVFLYDSNGNLVTELPNNTDTPMPLAPGNYIVLIGQSMDPVGQFHQVQVRVVDGKTTRVSQGDIDHAPSFWAMFR